MLDFTPFLVAAHTLDVAAFTVKLPVPALVLEPFVPESGTSLLTQPGSSAPGEHFALAKIEKRAGANPFTMMITIGRSSNNDVVLPHSSVSKFHAYVRKVGERWWLTDAGSTLGTLAGGKRLKPSVEQVALSSGDALVLGELAARFFLPADLHAWLRAQ